VDVETVLQEAIETGEIITIIYKGGSKPGAKRDISPISISNGKVRARCHSSNAVKHFMLEKIDLAVSGETKSEFWEDVEKKEDKTYESLESIYNEFNSSFKDMGWYVFMENNSLSLHRKQKRANKPLKASSVSLDYNEYTSDFVMGIDGEIREENIRKSTRPYALRANGKNTKTYGHLSSAVPQFIEWANELAPNKT